MTPCTHAARRRRIKILCRLPDPLWQSPHREDCLKKLLVPVRLSVIIAFLVASCAEGQQPPLQPGTPATAAPTPQTSPPPTSTPAQPAQPVVQNQSDTITTSPSLNAPWSIEGFYWLTHTTPALRGGKAALDFENLNYPGNGNYTIGAAINIPVSKSAMLNFSGFQSKASTSTTANQALDLFGTTYAAGDFLTANYTIRNFKLSFQDLLYPFPRKASQKWHLKTLWEVQYTSIKTNVNAPFAPTTDSSGNTLVNSVSGSRSVVYPTFGLAGEYHLTRNLVVQVNGSGFAIPHHAVIGDAEGSISYRLRGVELIVADKYYHFKTSTQNAEYFTATLMGPYAALRFYPSEIAIPCFFCRRRTVAANTSAAGNSENPSPAPAAGSTVSTTSSQSNNTSSSADQHTYVRRFSAGGTLSVLGLSLISSGTNTITNSSTVNTMYQTTGASSRIGYGGTAQVMLTDHFGVAIGGLLRKIGYQLNTTVTTTAPQVISGVVTQVTTSTILHEDTRAKLIDIPGVVRYYAHSRHDPGAHWFFEGGGAWRKVESIRTSTDFTNASSVLSCCTNTPATPAHASVFGIVAGAGVQLVDAFGVRVVPEVRYTRWMNPVFHAFTTNTQQNEVAVGFSITF